MYKVWYHLRGWMQVDLVEGSTLALRRAADLLDNPDVDLAGIEDPSGDLVERGFFIKFLEGYQLRKLDANPVAVQQWHVEVRSPLTVQRDIADEWVRWSAETDRDAAERRAAEVEKLFGAGRVRVAGATPASR